MNLDRPILSLKQAQAFLRALNDSGQLYHLGLGPEPTTEPQTADFSPQDQEDLSKRVSEVRSLNWKAIGFNSWIDFVGTLPCTTILKNFSQSPTPKINDR